MRTGVLHRAALGLVIMAGAQFPGFAQEKPQATSASSEQTVPGPRYGIKVHGHWTVIVRDPDGKTVSKSEFENALRPQGAAFLAKLLARQTTLQAWRIWLGTSGPYYYCLEPGASHGTNQFTTLTVSSPAEGTLVLSGSVTANANGQLIEMGTGVTDVKLPGDYNTYKDFSFRDLTVAEPSSTTAPAPIQLQANQKIDITVTFTFS